ncbi:thioredoxin-disulfide reductase [Gloeobacter kilaueensis]|uniref:Thioredoxin reductase n=1 Tax=Gloeobacter kilaueensis (strain ATCC BAA-2537 / CCAP 1431/1 / ULC 316 / JS1) TaxID=1183438 RepID=U5QLL3_GLOK1|nr:thioredoxin-disulfide reductase [Gloeobacter kilaueensis]AGY59783.1 thioredoxin reductase [Gloeobacter kilaueensis JS1]
MSQQVENLVIIGSGPAGYTAAIYAGRAQLSPLVFEGFHAWGIPGGQLMTTTEVENYPGFPEGIQGPELVDRLRSQALRWQARLVSEDVVAVDFTARPFVVRSGEREVAAQAVIVCTGARARRLHMPGEERLWQKGISVCATCDGPLPLFRGGVLAVVGGGDSACEEAIFLTRYASRVHLLVRSDQMRASKIMQQRVLAHPKIEIHWHSLPIGAHGKDHLENLTVADCRTGETRKLKVSGLFYAIGHVPNTTLFIGQLDLDEAGYIRTRNPSLATSTEGVWAAGDVQDPLYRQAITAAGSGCAAAIEVERWLSAQHFTLDRSSLNPQAAS